MIDTLKQCMFDGDEAALAKLLSDDIRLRNLNGDIITDKQSIITTLFTLTRDQSDTLNIMRYASLIILHTEDNVYIKCKRHNDLIRSVYIIQGNPSTTRYRIDFAYNGTCFDGFQRQKGHKRTIQTTIEAVLSHFSINPVTIHASGRTDKGVHAYQQTAHFDADIKAPIKHLIETCNVMLPNEIHVLKIEKVPPVFHARFDAQSKTYTYRLDHEKDPFNAHLVHVVPPIDKHKLHSILTPLQGTHDFLSFSKFDQEKNTTRTIDKITVEQTNTQTLIHVTANGFLRNMMRIMIGNALYDYSKQTQTIIENLKHPSKDAFKQLAPPQGLYLTKVRY